MLPYFFFFFFFFDATFPSLASASNRKNMTSFLKLQYKFLLEVVCNLLKVILL